MSPKKKVEEASEEATASDLVEEEIEVENDIEEATASGEDIGPEEEADTSEEVTAGEKSGDETDEENVSEESGDEAKAEPPQKHKTSAERINELTAQRYEAEANARIAEERYQDTLKQLDALKNPPKSEEVPAKLSMPKMPTRESVDFDDTQYAAAMDEYQEHLNAYYDQKFNDRLDQQEVARLQNSAESQRIEAAQKIDAAFQQRQDEFISEVDAAGNQKHADYNEIVFRDDLQIPTVVVAALKESENGPEILYQIARSPKLAQKLLELSPTQALMELGKLSRATNSALKKKKVSKAPEPIDPIDSSGQTNLYDDIENMPIGDFMTKETKKFYNV